MRLAIAILVSLLAAGPAAADTVEQDVDRYVAMFNGDASRHPASAESLGWMGLSSERLFDSIEKRLLQDAPALDLRKIKIERQRVAWYIRALGYSGQPKYKPTIERFLEDRDYLVYSKNALRDQPIYQRWNPQISDRAKFDASQSDDVNRAMNMVRSDDFRLKELGAKRVYYGNARAKPLYELLAAEIRANYLRDDNTIADPLAWMIKALASSRDVAYKALVEEIIEKAPHAHVVRHARSAASDYFPR